jgi:hypothetical protein
VLARLVTSKAGDTLMARPEGQIMDMDGVRIDKILLSQHRAAGQASA